MSLLVPGHKLSAVMMQDAYLKAATSESASGYGMAVAVSGDTLVIGAPAETRTGTSEKGAVYVYVRSGAAWTLQARLQPSVVTRGDGFGCAVAISHETIVVGAYGDDETAVESGAAFVFVRNGLLWSQQAVLKASNASAGDLFGWSVAIMNQDVVIGAFAEDGDGSAENNEAVDGAGAAYVFARNGATWTQQGYLKATNAGVGDAFGWAVAISGSSIVVGAPFEDSADGSAGNNGAEAAGAAYLFSKNTGSWVQQSYIKAANADAGDAFGHAVALAFDSLAVGAPFESSNGLGVNSNVASNNAAAASGAAYVYQQTSGTWGQQAYVKAENADEGDHFGSAVALSGDLLTVGAEGEDGDATGQSATASTSNAATDAGAVFALARTGTSWAFSRYLKASNTEANDGFGSAVATFGGYIVAGAAGEDSHANGVNAGASAEANNALENAGAAYAFGDVLPITLRQAWRLAYFGGSRNEGMLADAADADGDGVSNLAEYAFGTDPGSNASGSTIIVANASTLTSRGAPTTRTTTSGTSVNFRAVYGRRKNWQAAGLTYTVQFSGNLTTWSSSTATPTLLATDGGIDAVTVPYPFSVNGTKARFFRISVNAASQ